MGGELAYLAGRYVVTKTAKDGGGPSYDGGYPNGHHVYCRRLDDPSARVDFYQGTTLLGSDSTSPYAFGWASVAAGSYTLRAVAVDNAGASTTSATVTVSVSAPANIAPAVSLTAPAPGSSVTGPANITVSATASDSDGSVARVDFYQGTALIGSDTSSPYSVAWSSVPAGSYTFRAIAYDSGGASTTSASVS